MKNLSVVFLTTRVVNKNGEVQNFVMLPRQAPGKKMPGIRNGFGGKCEFLTVEGREETTLECAVRELKEESSGLEIKQDNFIKIGNIVAGDKFVDFFVVPVKSQLNIPDNDDIVDAKWFDVTRPDLFLREMLGGDKLVIEELAKYLDSPSEMNNLAASCSLRYATSRYQC